MNENNLYKLPEIKNFWFLVLVILLSSVFGFLAGLISNNFSFSQISLHQESRVKTEPDYLPQNPQEEAVVKVVRDVSDAVVSIIITKNLPTFEEIYINPFREFEKFFGPGFFEFQIPQYRQKGTERKEIGGGTGFIISEDGMILTNAHVVADEEADYTVLTNDGQKYKAKVLVRDTLRDLAIIKVENKKNFRTLKLGDSDALQIGQTVIAIGNALGEYRNTVSVGVISGLGRQVTAQGGQTIVTLEDVIQTDAAINRGNSGGPLLNLKGEVIGVNFALAEPAQNIGFAIPINKAKKTIEQVKTLGKVVYPFLGVRYVLIDEKIQKEKNLPVNYGAWVQKGDQGEPAIFPGSAAQKAGLQEGDIILEFNGQKITKNNSLAELILEKNPGDKVTLKILRGEKEFSVEVILDERASRS
jgi:S1-C subfamily serine protease